MSENLNWTPKVGDWFILKASYCQKGGECSEENPCPKCLEMCNRFVIAADHYGKDFFFGGGWCNRDGGILLNETHSYILTTDKSIVDGVRGIHHVAEAMRIDGPEITQLKQQLDQRDKVIAKWMGKAEELGEKAQIAEQQLEVSERNAGLYCATLTRIREALGVNDDPHMMDYAVQGLKHQLTESNLAYEQSSADCENLSVKLAEAERQLTAKTEELERVRWIIDCTEELNPSNYTHDQVCDLNKALCDVWEIVGNPTIKQSLIVGSTTEQSSSVQPTAKVTTTPLDHTKND